TGQTGQTGQKIGQVTPSRLFATVADTRSLSPMSAGGWVIFWAVVAVVVIAEFVRESKSKNSDIWDAGVERRRRG
ncbi:MAG: hypothetical protein QOG19_11, partial [Mycobacterium sp.]|nr:hypothetical protein [Mycobacterium sp.]